MNFPWIFTLITKEQQFNHMEALSNIEIISILITVILFVMTMAIPLEISQDVKNKKYKENFDKWIEYLVNMKRNFLSEQDEQKLKVEIQHIFDSGANEVRIFEMVKLFINQRQEKTLSAAYHQGSSDFYNSSDKEESQWKPFQDFLNLFYPLDVIKL